MHPAQIAGLSDHQLCSLSIGYRYEPNTEAEIGRRGIVCTPETVQCMGQGVQQHSPAMGFCASMARAQSFIEDMAYRQQDRADYALHEYGDESNARHVFRW